MQELVQAESLIRSGQPTRAIALLDRLADSQGGTYQVFLLRGIAHLQLQRRGEAVADFSRAIELNASCAAAYANRGSALDQLKQPGRAIEDHNAALKLEPTECQHYYNRGLAYANKGDLQQAVEDFSSALELNENYREALEWRAECFGRLGRHAEAAADRKRAGSAQAVNFRSTASKGLGCLLELPLVMGLPWTLGILDMSNWTAIMVGVLAFCMLDSLVSRLQNASAWTVGVPLSQLMCFLPLAALSYWGGGKLAALGVTHGPALAVGWVPIVGLAVFLSRLQR